MVRHRVLFCDAPESVPSSKCRMDAKNQWSGGESFRTAAGDRPPVQDPRSSEYPRLLPRECAGPSPPPPPERDVEPRGRYQSSPPSACAASERSPGRPLFPSPARQTHPAAPGVPKSSTGSRRHSRENPAPGPPGWTGRGWRRAAAPSLRGTWQRSPAFRGAVPCGAPGHLPPPPHRHHRPGC